MNIVEFYRRVLPETGMYCLVTKSMKHTWYETQEALVEATESLSAEPDLYFATNSFDGAKRRKQENVVAARSLRMDIDAGADKYAKHGDKVYASRSDAMVGVAGFIKLSGMKPTVIVSSGGGLHLYFSFDEDFTDLAMWDSASAMLERMAKSFGLRVDTTVTKDAARILRPVGSVHNNGNVVTAKALRDDYTLEEFIALFRAVESQLVADVVPRKLRGVNADIEGPPPVYAASSAVKAAKGCAWLNSMLEANGEVGYEDWFRTLGLLKHSSEGVEFAVQWSSGAAAFDEAETRFKIDSWSMGPPKCERISEDFAGCAGCVHNGKISSPIALGRLTDRELPRPAADVAAVVSQDEPAVIAATGDPASTAKLAEAVALARKYDQRDKLVLNKRIPASFPSVDDLLGSCPGTPFFIQRSTKTGRLVLYAYEEVKVETEAGPVTTYKAIALTEQPFYIHSYVASNGAQTEVIFEYIHQYDDANNAQWDSRSFETTELADTAGYRNILATLGVAYADAGKANMIMKIMRRYADTNLAVLRTKANANQVTRRMGFQFIKEKPVYVQGAYVALPNGTIERCALGGSVAKLREGYEMPSLPSVKVAAFEGDVYAEHILPTAAKFCEGIANLYNEDAPQYQLGWLLGVSSPYLAFVTTETPDPVSGSMPGMGIALSFYSTSSGLGKSALQINIQRAFGDPDRNKTGGDSDNGISAISVGVQLATRGSLPYMLDEVTNNDSETVSKLIHKISIGKDKVRANKDGSSADFTGSWTSVATLSTNVSQRMLLTEHRSSSSAEQMRLVEIDFDAVDKSKLNQIAYDRIYSREIAPNTGALGLLLGRYAVMNWDAMRERADKLVEQVIARYELQQSERYFSRIFAAALLTAQVMKAHGLNPVSLPTIDAMFRTVLNEVREYVASTTPSVTDYAENLIREVLPRILRTRTESDTRMAHLKFQGTQQYDIVDNPEILNRARIAGRYVAASKRLYLVSSEFTSWAMKNNLDARNLLRKWEMDGLYIPRGDHGWIQRRLNTGIHENVMPELRQRVYQFNLSNLSGVIEGEDGDNVVSISSKQSAAPQWEKESDEPATGTD